MVRLWVVLATVLFAGTVGMGWSEDLNPQPLPPGAAVNDKQNLPSVTGPSASSVPYSPPSQPKGLTEKKLNVNKTLPSVTGPTASSAPYSPPIQPKGSIVKNLKVSKNSLPQMKQAGSSAAPGSVPGKSPVGATQPGVFAKTGPGSLPKMKQAPYSSAPFTPPHQNKFSTVSKAGMMTATGNGNNPPPPR